MDKFEKFLASMDNTDVVWLMSTLDETVASLEDAYVQPEYKFRQDRVICALLAFREDVSESNLPKYVLHDDPDA
jgi:hypothetical protein